MKELILNYNQALNESQKDPNAFIYLNEAKEKLIKALSRKQLVKAFVKQLRNPFRGEELNGTFFILGKTFYSKERKIKKLYELEIKRLRLIFARDFKIQGFFNESDEERFFNALSFKTITPYFLDLKEYPYLENKIMLKDSITTAKQKLKEAQSQGGRS
ncbi:hypothetical protein AAH590_000471 [Campylobacter upsaliensis]